MADFRSARMKYGLTFIAIVLVVGLLESGARWIDRKEPARQKYSTVTELMDQLPLSRIKDREIGSQMLVHNIALFARHPAPSRVHSAYVGTSRTKILRPVLMGHADAVNASGNTYNEISYGLLLQAEAARLQFPNLKRVYFETSMLLRRLDRLNLKADHRKYLPLLKSLLPLRDQLPGAHAFRKQIEAAEEGEKRRWHLSLLDHRAEMRLSRLWSGGVAEETGLPVREDILFKQVDVNGQQIAAPGPRVLPERQAVDVTGEHIKVQRLRRVAAWAPWDGLFDLIALWGRVHGIEIVFFQPPVRSDLYQFKQKLGLPLHVADLERVSRQYGVPFIDLNRPGLGYLEDWSLFTDEDHMGTCVGVVLLQSVLDAGTNEYRKTGKLLPVISREQVERGEALARLMSCPG